MPFVALFYGLKFAWKAKIDPSEVIIPGGIVKVKEIPWWRLFERFGEALPQLCLTLTFTLNNFQFLAEYDSILGIPIPISLVSVSFP